MLVLALLVILQAGCGGESDGRLRIAVVPKGTAHDFWQSVHAGARQAAEALDVDIEWRGPSTEGDRNEQIKLIETFSMSGVQGIALAPVDANSLRAPVEQARGNGVPTVVFDSALDGDAHVSFVATDNRAAGEAAGRKLGELLGGKGDVIMLRFTEGSASTMAREEGFLAALAEDYPDVQVVDSSQYAPSVEAARTRADSLLLAHPDVDGVFCPNESTVHGFLAALGAAGKAGKVKFVGFDANPELLSGLEKGHIHALVLQDPVGMGRRSVELIVAHIKGATVPKVENTELVIATPDNRNDPKIQSLLEPDLSILGR